MNEAFDRWESEEIASFDPSDPMTWRLGSADVRRAGEIIALIEAFDRNNPATWREPKEVTDWEREGLTHEEIEADIQGMMTDAAEAEESGKLATAQVLRDAAERLSERLQAGPQLVFSRSEALAHWISEFRAGRPATWQIEDQEVDRMEALRAVLRHVRADNSSTWGQPGVKEIEHIHSEILRRRWDDPAAAEEFEWRAGRIVASALVKAREQFDGIAAGRLADMSRELEGRKLAAIRATMELEKELFDLRAMAVEAMAARFREASQEVKTGIKE